MVPRGTSRCPPGRRRHLLTIPACANEEEGGKPRPARGTGASPGAISGLSSCPPSQRNTQAHQDRYNSKSVLHLKAMALA
jgi:hypothetical protein